MRGSEERSCQQSREWSGDPVTCDLITCPVLRAPAFGTIQCSDENNFDSSCLLKCNVRIFAQKNFLDN